MLIEMIICGILVVIVANRERAYNYIYVRNLPEGQKPKMNVLLYLYYWRVACLVIGPAAFLYAVICVAWLSAIPEAIVAGITFVLFSIFPWTLFADPRDKNVKMVKYLRKAGVDVDTKSFYIGTEDHVEGER